MTVNKIRIPAYIRSVYGRRRYYDVFPGKFYTHSSAFVLAERIESFFLIVCHHYL